jgi:hypothetical protein
MAWCFSLCWQVFDHHPQVVVAGLHTVDNVLMGHGCGPPNKGWARLPATSAGRDVNSAGVTVVTFQVKQNRQSR